MSGGEAAAQVVISSNDTLHSVLVNCALAMLVAVLVAVFVFLWYVIWAVLRSNKLIHDDAS